MKRSYDTNECIALIIYSFFLGLFVMSSGLCFFINELILSILYGIAIIFTLLLIFYFLFSKKKTKNSDLE